MARVSADLGPWDLAPLARDASDRNFEVICYSTNISVQYRLFGLIVLFNYIVENKGEIYLFDV